MAPSPITSWQIEWEKVETVIDFLFLGFKITMDCGYSHEVKTLALWKESYYKPRQCIKKQRYHFAHKGLYSQSYGFSSSHVHIWELAHKEGQATKCCFWIMVLDKTLESPLDSKEIKPVHPKGNQPWIFIGRSDAEAEAPILWPPDWKRPWCWERLREGGKRGNRKWDGWMASSIQWTWVWKNWVTVKDGEVWRAAVHVVSEGQTRPRDNNRAILISTVLLLANIYELLNQWCRWALSGWKIRHCSCFWLISQADFPDGPVVKNPPARTGDTGSIPGPGRSHKPQGDEAS